MFAITNHNKAIKFLIKCKLLGRGMNYRVVTGLASKIGFHRQLPLNRKYLTRSSKKTYKDAGFSEKFDQFNRLYHSELYQARPPIRLKSHFQPVPETHHGENFSRRSHRDIAGGGNDRMSQNVAVPGPLRYICTSREACSTTVLCSFEVCARV